MSDMQVDLVAVDRQIWSGTATFVLARTVEGEIGIMPKHSPLVAQLDYAMVRIDSADESQTWAVDGGFVSVEEERVSILVDDAQPADEIDAEQAQQEFDSEDELTHARGKAKLRALGRVV
mgnify:CR=1 FL=1